MDQDDINVVPALPQFHGSPALGEIGSNYNQCGLAKGPAYLPGHF
jgi:hypothetical protein